MLPLPDRCQSSRHGNGTIRHLLLTRPPPHPLPHPLPAPKGKKKSTVGSSKCLEGIRCQLHVFAHSEKGELHTSGTVMAKPVTLATYTLFMLHLVDSWSV